MVNGWLVRAHEWLFPVRCVLCGDPGVEGMGLCAACRRELPTAGHHQCYCCAAPLSVSGVCGRCQRKAPSFQRTLSAFSYAPPVDHLIQALKFHGKLDVARLLGGLMAEHLVQRTGPLPELLIPVPLHPSRLKERGYNQALELARPVSKRLSIPIDYRSCRRVRATATQSLLPVVERQRNVKGVFSVEPRMDARHVAIIDDVMTSGHTAGEFAQALRRAGVDIVEVWVCGRASPIQ